MLGSKNHQQCWNSWPKWTLVMRNYHWCSSSSTKYWKPWLTKGVLNVMYLAIPKSLNITKPTKYTLPVSDPQAASSFSPTKWLDVWVLLNARPLKGSPVLKLQCNKSQPLNCQCFLEDKWAHDLGFTTTWQIDRWTDRYVGFLRKPTLRKSLFALRLLPPFERWRECSMTLGEQETNN